MTPEQELWACALLVERQHGDGSEAFIAERMRALAGAGETAGVERWRAIAARLDQVRGQAARRQ